MTIIKRGDVFYLKKRVPVRFRSVETRTQIWISLSTDSKTEAEAKVPSVWAGMIEGWQAEIAGNSELAEERFTVAKRLAERMGHNWMPSGDVAGLPLKDLLRRVEESAGPKGGASKAKGDALLGGVEKPKLTTDKVLDQYWDLAADKIRGKTRDQLRRYKNPRIKAFKLFHEVNGPVVVSEISRDHMLRYREFLMERINSDGLSPASANKDLLHFCGPINYLNDMNDWRLDLPFQKLSFKEGPKSQRATFSTDWIRNQILGAGRLDNLNDQARRIVQIMINTGARPSEIAGTKLSHFDLTANIPLMYILPEDRQLKNDHSRRAIPLVGISLEAARKAVIGAQKANRDEVFPRYFGKDKISAAVNSFFVDNGLKETPETTLYSIRHNFEDRLLEADVPDRVRSDLFGHSYQRQKYGTGGGHELRHKALQKIAL